MGKILGIDQGITSVGWGIIDTEKNEIIDAGVRLFPEADKANNEGRRSFRGGRRLKRRKVTRREDLQKLLKEKKLLFDNYNKKLNPYECRVKGLKEKISLEELNCALFNICKHRGSSLEVIEDEKTSESEASTKYQLSQNDALIKSGKYVCEIQLERLNTTNKIRGTQNNFRTTDYISELKQLLKTQEINDDISNEIIATITRKRHFDEGPGDFKSQTPYGRIYNEDGTVKMGMIEKMTGHCSIFPNELRSPKLAPSAELFNLLNDVNNLSVDDEIIDINIKQNIIDTTLEKGSITPKKVADILGVDLEDIKGFRIDKNGKPLLTELVGYKIFKKAFTNHSEEDLLKNFDLMDDIAIILTKTKVKEERIEEIKKLIDNTDLVEELSLQTKFSAYHALSLKAIKLLNEELLNTQYNQMQILTLSDKFEFNRAKGSQKNKKKIAINNDAILSPVAMRSYKQAIKVINAARKKYGEFDSIIIETTRDKNSKEQKSRINESQKYYENQNKKVKERLEAYPNIKPNAKLREKILLYEEQEAKTMYTQQPINIDLLITDSTAYEVDHIIPVSVSLDDSINNKVLVSRTENQDKENMTPIMAFSRNAFEGSKEQYLGFIKSLYANHKISRKKYQNLTYDKDINKYENMKDFIARNLVDTSYANRLLLNTLQDYFKDNNIDTKVHTVKGFATNRFRKYIKLQKDRDVDYSHHAIDALLIASIKKMAIYRNLFKDFSVNKANGIVYNRETGEVLEDINDVLASEEEIKFIQKISNYDVVKYSHMIDTKPNRSIADQTIYSTRNYGDGDVVIKKYKDIYDKKFTDFANDVLNGKAEEKYLIAKHDKQTYDIMKDIVMHYYELHKEDKEYIDEKKGKVDFKFNPFEEHLSTTEKYVYKYSKNGKGPLIKSLKYIDGKLGSHVDISQNYISKNKKVVLQQISAYRTDFYEEENGSYKFVTVRYANIRYNKTKNKYVIDSEWYKEQLEKKKISENAKFLFSMHHNELIKIIKEPTVEESIDGLVLYTATNNDETNRIEYKSIDHKTSKQRMLTIGKSIKHLEKHAVDVLGNDYIVEDSVLKLEFE